MFSQIWYPIYIHTYDMASNICITTFNFMASPKCIALETFQFSSLNKYKTHSTHVILLVFYFESFRAFNNCKLLHQYFYAKQIMMITHLSKTWYRHNLFFIDDQFAKTKNEFMNSGTLLQNIWTPNWNFAKMCFLLEMFICNCCF